MMKKWNKFGRKLKNLILKSITVLSIVIFVISGLCLDSECWIPFFIALMGASAWLIAFSYANDF